MKIEKLTENKIRIVLNIEDLKENNIDIDCVLNNSPESQTLILSILNRAQKEVGFCANDSKVLIETISFPDGIFIFTITKSPYENYTPSASNFYRKKPSAKRKLVNLNKERLIYSFANFENFCEFCNALDIYVLTENNFSFLKNSSLFVYDNTYYLIFYNLNAQHISLSALFPIISEFANHVECSNNFEAKLIEHGKAIFKKNAIINTFNLFIHPKK